MPKRKTRASSSSSKKPKVEKGNHNDAQTQQKQQEQQHEDDEPLNVREVLKNSATLRIGIDEVLRRHGEMGLDDLILLGGKCGGWSEALLKRASLNVEGIRETVLANYRTVKDMRQKLAEMNLKPSCAKKTDLANQLAHALLEFKIDDQVLPAVKFALEMVPRLGERDDKLRAVLEEKRCSHLLKPLYAKKEIRSFLFEGENENAALELLKKEVTKETLRQFHRRCAEASDDERKRLWTESEGDDNNNKDNNFTKFQYERLNITKKFKVDIALRRTLQNSETKTPVESAEEVYQLGLEGLTKDWREDLQSRADHCERFFAEVDRQLTEAVQLSMPKSLDPRKYQATKPAMLQQFLADKLYRIGNSLFENKNEWNPKVIEDIVKTSSDAIDRERRLYDRVIKQDGASELTLQILKSLPKGRRFIERGMDVDLNEIICYEEIREIMRSPDLNVKLAQTLFSRPEHFSAFTRSMDPPRLLVKLVSAEPEGGPTTRIFVQACRTVKLNCSFESITRDFPKRKDWSHPSIYCLLKQRMEQLLNASPLLSETVDQEISWSDPYAKWPVGYSNTSPELIQEFLMSPKQKIELPAGTFHNQEHYFKWASKYIRPGWSRIIYSEKLILVSSWAQNGVVTLEKRLSQTDERLRQEYRKLRQALQELANDPKIKKELEIKTEPGVTAKTKTEIKTEMEPPQTEIKAEVKIELKTEPQSSSSSSSSTTSKTKIKTEQL